jgi:hypothetical protein
MHRLNNNDQKVHPDYNDKLTCLKHFHDHIILSKGEE